jgi:hypothetical protein
VKIERDATVLRRQGCIYLDSKSERYCYIQVVRLSCHVFLIGCNCLSGFEM